MHIKLSWYPVLNRYSQSAVSVEIGTKVMPSNGTKSVGVIIGIGEKTEDNYYDVPIPIEVTVLWGTGKKRGQTSVHDPDSLINFDNYLTQVEKEYKELKDLNKEATTVGL